MKKIVLGNPNPPAPVNTPRPKLKWEEALEYLDRWKEKNGYYIRKQRYGIKY